MSRLKPPIHEIGKKYNRMTIISIASRDENSAYNVLCKCDCGNEKIVRLGSLRGGNTKSCGCYRDVLRKDKIIREYKECSKCHIIKPASEFHAEARMLDGLRTDCKECHTEICREWAKENGERRNKASIKWSKENKWYTIYSAMMSRCYNPNTRGYKNYGGRGISVCDEWRGQSHVFKEWFDTANYKKDYQLDRKDNEKGYSPENCRFVSRQVNNQNRRNIKLNPCDIPKIKKQFHSLGMKPKEIAEIFDVKCAVINNILSGKTWANIA